MLTVSPDIRIVEDYAAYFTADDDWFDRVLPKDPWFHSVEYIHSAYYLLEGLLKDDWGTCHGQRTLLHLHGAPAGATITVDVDLIGPEPHEQTLSGVVLLDLPTTGTVRLALPHATRDTDLFSAAHLYDPPAQIAHVIGSFCTLVDRALAPVAPLLHAAA